MDLRQGLHVGMHRPVYLWAGPGTIRMNRLKFMGAPVNEAVHFEAHTATGAARMAQEAAFNWAYLMYDWGFPPEIAAEDWQSFRDAVRVYHDYRLRVLGYIQTSNCAFSGSYQQKDWYACDPRGRKIYYYTGRYMACWLHPEWQEHLRVMVRGVIDAGADAVFFDNPWHASQPLHFWGVWMGGAGCYCPRCQAAYQAASGQMIPKQLAPDRDEASWRYLRWRASQVTRILGELAAYVRHLKSDVLVSVNDFDAVMRPSYLIYGIDLVELAGVQDVIMIEDYGLPRWQPAQGNTNELLVNNALTLRTALALAGSTPVTTDPYDKGIGFDDVYPARRFEQGIAEAAACGVPMVVKGTEFVSSGQFTLLTAEPYLPQRQAIGHIQRWLQTHSDLYQGRRNQAPIGLLHPGEAFWQQWEKLAPAYFGAGQTLTAAGLPWRVVTAGQSLEGLQVLLTFSNPSEPAVSQGRIHQIDVLELPGFGAPPPAFLERNPWLARIVSGFAVELFRAYFHSRLVRRLLDGLGLAHFFLLSPFFQLPAQPARQALLDALGPITLPHIQSTAPVLVEFWEQAGAIQLHLVNYGPQLQVIHLEYPHRVLGQVLSPGAPDRPFETDSLDIELDVYAVVVTHPQP